MIHPPPRDGALRRTLTTYLSRWWAARHCRPGDRVVEVTRGPSTLIPFLLAQDTHPHSLTVLHLDTVTARPDHGRPRFPITYRRADPFQPWPVAGPVDLVVDVDPAVAPASDGASIEVVRALRHGAELLTVHGQAVITAPAPPSDPWTTVGTARLLLDTVHGLALPSDNDLVDRELSARFGGAAVELVRRLRSRCPAGIVDPAVASVLVDVPTRVVCTYRRIS